MPSELAINRTVDIPARRSMVWDALTDAEHLAEWFSDEVALELRPDGAATFTWAEYGTFHAVVSAVEEARRFSYRWANPPDTAVAEGNSTLVTFELEDYDGGTRLTVSETGWEELTESNEELRRDLQNNCEGWDKELADLVAFLAEETGS